MYNRIKISILAVLFLTSCREVIYSLCGLMTFSDAQPVQFWPLECNTYNQQESDGVHHKCFCQPWQCDDEIKIQFTESSDSSPDIPDEFELSIKNESGSELLTLPFDVADIGTRFVYSLSLISSELSPEICNELIQFVVINTTSGTPVYQSDCQDIRTEHKNTILINYRNHRNVFGLVYDESFSPDIDFNLRIPAIFFHQRFPKEEEVMQLSSSLVSQNSVIRKQRLMDIDYVPYYFHEKINLILQHQFISIFNREWVTQEAYEIPEGDRRWPVKKGKIYLTEKDFVMRNVL
jgi:hypothetical protein